LERAFAFVVLPKILIKQSLNQIEGLVIGGKLGLNLLQLSLSRKVFGLVGNLVQGDLLLEHKYFLQIFT